MARTARPCPICPHPFRRDIERDLARLRPAWLVAKTWGVSRYYLVRHLSHCELLPETQAAYQRVLQRFRRKAEELWAEWHASVPSAADR